MPHIPHWVEAQLSTHFEDLNLAVGVDFDGSGVIEDSERTDTNSDGIVDADEWRLFLNQNESTLRNLGGFFNYYFDYGTSFKADNPLHDILFIESVLADEMQIAGAYQLVGDILQDIKRLINGEVQPPPHLEEYVDRESENNDIPKDQLRNLIWAAYYIFNRNLMKGPFENQNSQLFIENINEGFLDCDTSGDVILAIGHEMNWPVYMVLAPSHAFIRWDDGDGTIINFDMGHAPFFVSRNDSIQQDYDVTLRSLRERIYLNELSYDEMLGLYYYNIAATYFNQECYEEALKYSNMSLTLRPTGVDALTLRAQVQENMQDAFNDVNRALYFDPHYTLAFVARGVLRMENGDPRGAVEDLERASELDPNDESGWSDFLWRARAYYWNSRDMGGGPF